MIDCRVSHVSCVLKRFPLTTGRNFVMLCVNWAFLLTGKISLQGWLHQNATLSFDAPGGGGASGGSLRSSRQAVACHPFTRSWATMPPETPPPPPGFSCHVVILCVVRKSLLCNKLTFFRVAVMRTLKIDIDIYLIINYLCSTPRVETLI